EYAATFFKPLPEHFSLNKVQYDFNGNIEHLQRSGKIASTYGMLDDLSYTYQGNRLLGVNDAVADNPGMHDFADNGSEYTPGGPAEYFYDENGNMTRDNNKGITNIEYNLLNLPQKIDFTDGNRIEYKYDAAGNKLQKIFTVGATTTTTNYLGSFVYNDVDGLEYVLTNEGMLNKQDDGTYRYEYYLKDHLGNNRVMFTKGTDGNALALQENNYYPFGMRFGELTLNNENKYLYNGKEFQDDNNLDWHDYGARMYDAQLGRWHVVDPLANESHNVSFSTYNYCINNPILIIDPDGMDWVEGIDENGNTKWTVTVQVRNTAGLSTEEIQSKMNAIEKSFESINQGTDENGVSYSTDLVVDWNNKDEASNDFYIDFVNVVTNADKKSTNADGKVDVVGNSKANRIQILANSDKDVGLLGTHELGHTGGLYHVDMAILKDVFGHPISDDNVMDPIPTGQTAGSITGYQLNRISQTIKRGKKLPYPKKSYKTLKYQVPVPELIKKRK
ncbi:MAG: RHS repeat-associated core domain-containing protein, partial [Bacteroidales bacterium]|nr:RHS repeat-associated core domain-containing protein [Bacteroidales bacterium]